MAVATVSRGPEEFGEGPLERRLWRAGYALVLVLVALGAARQLWKLFG